MTDAKGELFSRLYVEKATGLVDSARARVRIASHVVKLNDSVALHFMQVVKRELGLEVPWGGVTWEVETFLKKCVLHDFLDCITLITHLCESYGRGFVPVWLEFARRVLNEERLPYRIDDKGGVHPRVDQEFEHSREAIVAGLDKENMGAARHSLEEGFRALRADNADTLAAVRAAFDAVENVFKSRSGEPRLGSRELENFLRPILERKYSGRARNGANQLLSSFSNFVNAAHQYRHADGESEQTPPPLELAVAFLSLSAGFLRWLLDLTSDA